MNEPSRFILLDRDSGNKNAEGMYWSADLPGVGGILYWVSHPGYAVRPVTTLKGEEKWLSGQMHLRSIAELEEITALSWSRLDSAPPGEDSETAAQVMARLSSAREFLNRELGIR